MNDKKLFKSGIILTLGNLIVQGLSFFTLPIYTRILSIEVFGEFNLYISWVSIFSIFIGFQLSGSLGVAKVKYKEKYKEYTINIFKLSNLIFISFLFIIFLFRDIFSTLTKFNSNYVMIIIVQSYLGYISGFVSNYFIQIQDAIKSFYISIFTALCNIFLSLYLIIYIMENTLLARIIGNLVPSIVIAIFSLYYFYKEKEIKYNKEYILFALSISLPLIFHHLGHNILNQFDRIMLGKIKTINEVGIYSFGYNLGSIMQIVLNSINMAWIPWFFKSKKENNEYLSYFIFRYLYLGLFLTLGYLTIFPELSLIMGGEKYNESTSFISLIIISYFFVFLYTFPVNIQFYNENTKFIPIGTLLAGILNITLNYIFIPIWGIYGAALATVISYIILLILHHCVTKKLYNYNDVNFQTYTKLSLIVITYSLIMNYFIDNLLIRWSFGVIVLLIYGFYFKKDIVNIFENMKKKKNDN